MSASTTRRRLFLVLPLALAIVGLAGLAWTREEVPRGPAATGESGAPMCGPTLRRPTDGAGAHIDDEPISYDSSPPAFGDHSSRWEVRALPFYDVESRPAVSTLVHNLEHGYNILWYDETVIADADALAMVREIADAYATLDRERDPATAFIAAPWTSEDGPEFPGGADYALTHWYADPTDRTRSRADELGLTRYCADISAAVVRQWMTDHPLRAAPEGFPELM